MIEYLRTENRALKEKLGKKRILLNDDQRRYLAVKRTCSLAQADKLAVFQGEKQAAVRHGCAVEDGGAF